MGISCKPSETVVGGLIQDVDVRITRARYCVFDYEGKAAKPCLAVKVSMEPVEGGDVIEQYYSAGSLERFAPSDDNETAITEVGDEGHYVVAAPGSTATQLSRSSNFIFFMQELANAGFPEEKMTDDIAFLEGSVIHIVRKPAPKREGMAGAAEPVAGAREKAILVASKVLEYPWDKKKGKAAAAAAGSKSVGGDVTALTIGIIKTVLASNGGTITPNDAKKNAFPALIKNKSVTTPERTAILSNLIDPAWLKTNQSEQSGFAFDEDGGVIHAV